MPFFHSISSHKGYEICDMQMPYRDISNFQKIKIILLGYQESIELLRKSLSNGDWSKQTTVIWGMKDRWLSFGGVSAFTSSVGVKLLQLQEVRRINPYLSIKHMLILT